MPKIKITEHDQTGKIQAGVISNVVYVPIAFNTIGTTQLSKSTIGDSVFSDITLFRSAKDFITAADETITVESNGENTGDATGKKTGAVISNKSLGYRLCVHLLNIGFQILVEALGSGEKPSWTKLEDKNLYDIRFLTLGALKETNFDLTDETQSMITTAEKRGDCVALINADESAEDFSYKVTDVRGKFENLTAGEYAAAFTPWFYSKNPDLIASSSPDEAEKIPAAFGYLFAYANATKNNPEWYAIAGFQRGIIPELSDVCHNYTTADVEVLQARATSGEVELDADTDNVGVAINPIAYVRPAGHIIYGNRTLRTNDASKKLIASSFLNIRNGLSAIKKLMYEAAKKYTFEPNNEALWVNFQAYITPLLDKMQSGNGILGYSFVKETTDAKARLKARLTIVPIEAVEDFELDVYLADDLTVSE